MGFPVLRLRLPMAVALAILSAPGWLHAQEAPAPAAPEHAAQPSGQRGQGSGQQPPSPDHRLPPDSITKQTVTLPGRTLAFTAVAGSIRLFNDKGEPEADIAYTAYLLDGADPKTRPVTFAFNGGPGSASTWLHLGNAGPWRLSMAREALSPSAPPDLTPNAETWLDFTDLVFIDPVTTGYSRFVASGEDVRKRYFSVNGDAASISVVIRRWLEKSDRLLSPKYLLGESYGGIRGPKIVNNLQRQQGVGVNGLILVSPVLDFRDFTGSSILQYMTRLPTMAAVAREAKGPVTRADMADVEKYATTDFLVDLIRGQADVEANSRLSDKVAALTGIDPAVSRRLGGRFAENEFRREFDRRSGRVAGRYDASVSGLDPYPDSNAEFFGDAASDPLTAPMTSAVVDLTTRKLNWRPDGSYNLFSGAAGRSWDYGGGINPAESVDQIRQILALDPNMKLFVAHGLFDMATPYLGSKVVLDQLPAKGFADRVKFVVYPGGHMFYSRDASRQAFRAAVEALMK